MEYYSALTGRNSSVCVQHGWILVRIKKTNYNGGYHGLRGGELNGELLFNEYSFSFIKTKSVMEVDGGDGCMTLWKHLNKKPSWSCRENFQSFTIEHDICCGSFFFSYIAFVKFSFLLFLVCWVFLIRKVCWILSNLFSAWRRLYVFPFILFMSYILLIDFCILNQTCIPRLNLI